MNDERKRWDRYATIISPHLVYGWSPAFRRDRPDRTLKGQAFPRHRGFFIWTPVLGVMFLLDLPQRIDG